MRKKFLKIALDYDDTFTEDKAFWTAVVRLAQHYGHQVSFVTVRPEEDWDNKQLFNDAQSLGIDTHFTNGFQKSKVYQADIWIDDWPALIPSKDELLEMYEGCVRSGEE